MATQKINLEQSLTELESIIEQMESEQLPLEKSLQLFEKGVGLLKRSQKALAQAEQQIQILLKDKKTLAPFDEGN